MQSSSSTRGIYPQYSLPVLAGDASFSTKSLLSEFRLELLEDSARVTRVYNGFKAHSLMALTFYLNLCKCIRANEVADLLKKKNLRQIVIDKCKLLGLRYCGLLGLF